MMRFIHPSIDTMGWMPPERAGNIYGAPREGAEVFNINAGE